MTLTAISELKKNNGENRFFMLGGINTRQQEAYVLNRETKKIELVDALNKSLIILGNIFPIAILKAITKFKTRQRIELLSNIDAVIDISGFFLTSNFGKRIWYAALKRFLLIRLLKKLNINYFILPQAMGPFDDWRLRMISKRILELADLVIVRDEKSLDYVKTLGIKKEIHLLPDIAFLFERKKLEELRRIRKEKKTKLTVAIAPNMRVYERSFRNDGSNNYLDILRSFIQELPKETEILLVPHEIKNKNTGKKDDVYLCNQLLKRNVIKQSSKLSIVKKKTAKEIKEVISGADVVIASRFHTAVGALSYGIPTMTIGWADKYPELLKLFDLEDFAIDYRNLNLEDMKKKFSELVDNRKEISNKIENKLPEIMEKANKVFELVESSLNEKE